MDRQSWRIIARDRGGVHKPGEKIPTSTGGAMKVLVLGAGLQGSAAAFDLLRNPDVERVGLADVSGDRLDAARLRLGDRRLALHELDVRDSGRVAELMGGYRACLSAVNYWFNLDLTRAAIEAGIHFCDLGGNNDAVNEQIHLDALAFEAGVTVVPDCGLAPGLANVLAAHGIRKLDEAHAVRIRVGGLPRHPRGPLQYQLVFAVEGLINEYAERCVIVRDGVKLSVEPLTEIEEIEFPEPFGKLEAFHTSGGLSTLARTFAGKVRDMDYKTIRYPGHCARMRPLLELGLFGNEPVRIRDQEVRPRQLTALLLEQQLAGDGPDAVLLRVTVQGTKYGGRRRLEYELVDHYDADHHITAMMRCTAYPASIVVQMLAGGRIPQRGVVVQERCVPAEDMMAELAKRGVQIVERQS
jgi:lysine 6-dehydrogenase